MSQLATRIARLEQALPPCPECRNRRTEIELATPGRPAHTSRAQFCPGCGERVELITIALTFDPDRPVAAAGAEAGT
jgi:hypothetical protein